MTDDDHRELADVLRNLQGMVLLSGYRCPLYDELYADWERDECRSQVNGGEWRTECLWLSPSASAKRRMMLPGFALADEPGEEGQ